MEDVIKNEVESKMRKKPGVNSNVYVLSSKSDITQFVSTRYAALRLNLSGDYQKWSSSGTQYYYHFPCIRSGRVLPHSSRNVNCTAYVSYKLNTDYEGYVAIVERINDVHCGHNPEEQKDKHVYHMSPELIAEATRLLELGVAPDVVLVHTQRWAKANGYNDPNDRRYYASPDDIGNLRKRVLFQERVDKNDCMSTHSILTNEFQKNVCFYQSHIENTQTFIAVLQTTEMSITLKSYGKHVLFMDATHSLNQYGFPLYSIMVRDDHCNGQPVFYMILGNDDYQTLNRALQAVRERLPFVPKFFMVDKDQKEIKALEHVFPKSKILLCWFHVLQAVQRWMMRRESGISGTEGASLRGKVIHTMSMLKSKTTVQF